VSQLAATLLRSQPLHVYMHLGDSHPCCCCCCCCSTGKPGSISAGGNTFEVTAAMCEIKRVKKKLAGRNYVPSVIEPSFGIGRILYCIFEHSYYTREVRSVCRQGSGEEGCQFCWGGLGTVSPDHAKGMLCGIKGVEKVGGVQRCAQCDRALLRYWSHPVLHIRARLLHTQGTCETVRFAGWSYCRRVSWSLGRVYGNCVGPCQRLRNRYVPESFGI
jgi:hypothetical protein